MHINATLINLYHVCTREMWLHFHGIRMEHTSEIVAEGKLIGETSYPQRAEKYTELEIEGAKIDFYDTKNKIVHEVKKSDKVEGAHIAHVKYYLYLLKKMGVDGAEGVIEYPKLRQKELVTLNEPDIIDIEIWLKDISLITQMPIAPPLLNKPICKNCSYYDFCYSTEL